MLSVIILSIIMQCHLTEFHYASVILQCVNILIAIMLNVMAPRKVSIEVLNVVAIINFPIPD